MRHSIGAKNQEIRAKMPVQRSLWVLETGFSPKSGSVTLQPEDRLPEGDQADMQKRGQASPDDGDALAPPFAQTVAPQEMEEERDEEDEFLQAERRAGSRGKSARTAG
jgi:hypothetical protein